MVHSSKDIRSRHYTCGWLEPTKFNFFWLFEINGRLLSGIFGLSQKVEISQLKNQWNYLINILYLFFRPLTSFFPQRITPTFLNDRNNPTLISLVFCDKYNSKYIRKNHLLLCYSLLVHFYFHKLILLLLLLIRKRIGVFFFFEWGKGYS